MEALNLQIIFIILFYIYYFTHLNYLPPPPRSYLDTLRVGEHRPQSPLENLRPKLDNVEDRDCAGGGDTQETESSLPDASSGLQLCADSDLRLSDELFNDVFEHVAIAGWGRGWRGRSLPAPQRPGRQPPSLS